MSIELDNCMFCGGICGFEGANTMAIWVECCRCFARGPVIDRKRQDAAAQAAAAWAAGRKFGRVGIANVPGGMPAVTCGLAERIRLIAEGMYRGDHGEPDSFVLLMRTKGSVNVTTHNISNGDFVRVLDAVRDASRVRAATQVPQRRN